MNIIFRLNLSNTYKLIICINFMYNYVTNIIIICVPTSEAILIVKSFESFKNTNLNFINYREAIREMEKKIKNLLAS